MKCKLREAIEADKEYLYELYKRCYLDVVIEQFGKWDDEWQHGNFDITYASSKYQIIVREGRDIGAFSIRFKSGHIFLDEMLIDPLFQNRGLGTILMKDIFDIAKYVRLPVKLQLLRKSRAKRLYTRLGMKETGNNATHIFMERTYNNGMHSG